MDLELIAVPGLRTLTARLMRICQNPVDSTTRMIAHRLAGSDLEDLGGKADGALDAELLVLRAVNQVARD